jgi:O-succinylbenzoic acid--CoA ligase
VSLSLAAAALGSPDGLAVIGAEGTLTFAELARRVAGAVERLRAMPSNDAPCAFVAEPNLASVLFVHACIASGRAVAPLHPKFVAAERERWVSRVGATFIADVDALLAPASRPGRVSDAQGAAPGTGAPFPNLEDDERCLAVLPTSGTTGDAKGVVLSRRAFLASARASSENLGSEERDRWLLSLPLAHVGGLNVLTRCLLARRALVLAEPGDTEALIRGIELGGVTLASLVPAQLARLLTRSPTWDPPRSLRALLVGGAHLPSALRRAARERGWPVLTTYGLTETCSQVTTESPLAPGLSGAGRPLRGVEVRTRDGAIEVRGATLFSGYLPSLPDCLTRDGWFRTGDLGSFDESGVLHVTGRAAELIVTGGENVYAAEVERALEACPGLREACVFGVPDEVWGERVAAAVAGEFTNAALAATLNAELASFKRPRLIARLPELPRLPTGKLDRLRARELATPRLLPLMRG